MNLLGPWALSQAIDLIAHNRGRDRDRETPDDGFAWGKPQRFDVGRIKDDQRLSLRGRIDLITLGTRSPGERRAGGRQPA